jgi:hypothetical protein
MLTRTARGSVAVVAATLLLALAVESSSARSLSVSEKGFRAAWVWLEFSAGVSVRCNVTLEGSFHTATIAKVEHALIGAIARAIVRHPCTGGEVWADNGREVEPLGTAPNKLPWHLSFESFVGTLPAILYLRTLLSRFSFVIQGTVLGLTCRGRYGTSFDSMPLQVSLNEGATGSIFPTGATMSLAEQLGSVLICPSTASLGGTGTLASAVFGPVRVTLI